MNQIEREVIDQVHEEWITRQITAEGRLHVKDVLDTWFLAVRKKPLPDLQERIDGFRKRIQVLADSFQVAIQDGQFVVKATGDAESTLRAIARGSDWFDPAGDVTVLIIGAVFE